jgi:hypothetical protein
LYRLERRQSNHGRCSVCQDRPSGILRLFRKAVAAAENGIEPPQVSFKGAKQAVTAFAPKIEAARSEEREALIDALLRTIAYHRVGDRPGRWEPRARKHRPKPGNRLMQPRATARPLQNRSKYY